MANAYRTMIKRLFDHNQIKAFDYDFILNNNSLTVRFDVANSITLEQLNLISYLLGTTDIEVTSFENRGEYILEIEAGNVDTDNIKMQIIYMKTRHG